MSDLITVGEIAIPLERKSLGAMSAWRAAVAEAIRPALQETGNAGGEAFADFMHLVAARLTLETKLDLVCAWDPSVTAGRAAMLATGTDEELEGAFAALMRRAYPLPPASPIRPGRTNGAAMASTATPSSTS